MYLYTCSNTGAHIPDNEGSPIPTTLHELFCNLVLCCIVRELDTHGESENDASEVTSLDDLPDDLRSYLHMRE